MEKPKPIWPDKDQWFLAAADPILDDEGLMNGAVFTLKDITAHKKAEEENKQLQANLLQAQKMESIGRLAGSLSHDFSNFLLAITGHSEIAMKQIPRDHPARRSLDIIRNAGEKAATLAKQLLTFSRKQVLSMEVTNLNTVLKEIVEIFIRTIQENITVQLMTEKPVNDIIADRGKIEQVILNLIINACDAMPNGGTLIIKTADTILNDELGPEFKGVKPGSYVMLAVSDTGEGIPPELKDRIFEPFFTTKESGKGTGLGLSTVYGIVKQHNGHITTETALGRGTIFKIYFPVVEKGEAETERPSGST